MFSIIRGNKCIRTDGTITENPGGASCICVPKVEFPDDGCSESISEVVTVKTRRLRETSLRGRKGQYSAEAIKTTVWIEYRLQRLAQNHTGFPSERLRGEVTSLDKSVFFRTQQGFGYDYGVAYREPNSTNLDKGI